MTAIRGDDIVSVLSLSSTLLLSMAVGVFLAHPYCSRCHQHRFATRSSLAFLFCSLLRVTVIVACFSIISCRRPNRSPYILIHSAMKSLFECNYSSSGGGSKPLCGSLRRFFRLATFRRCSRFSCCSSSVKS